MTSFIKVAQQSDFKPHELAEMYRLRTRIFRDRMQWDVRIVDGMEIDEYDHAATYYLQARDQQGALCGCWRLLQTHGQYMLRNTFPSLLHGSPPPTSPRIWELSRFAFQAEKHDGQFGFSDPAKQFISAILEYGAANSIDHYVTVTTTAIERMLRRLGVVTRRFGPPQRIGPSQAVALWIDIARSAQALSADPVPAP